MATSDPSLKDVLNERPYSRPFLIRGEYSNNVFSYNKRAEPELYVAGLAEGSPDDVECGDRIVFEDFDENGTLRSCKGLRRFIKFGRKEGTVPEKNIVAPVYIFDNHNHAFYFWHLELMEGRLHRGSLLIHVDQHKDTRQPDSFLERKDLKNTKKLFEYTNTVLNVGNFIPAAMRSGLVAEVLYVDSENGLKKCMEVAKKGTKSFQSIILDVDLDFFAPEMDYLDNEAKIEAIRAVLPLADIITFATSPFFIAQGRAIKRLRQIL